jgi:hypothetical protein
MCTNKFKIKGVHSKTCSSMVCVVLGLLEVSGLVPSFVSLSCCFLRFFQFMDFLIHNMTIFKFVDRDECVVTS